MNHNDFFEMNDLNSSESLNLDINAYRQPAPAADSDGTDEPGEQNEPEQNEDYSQLPHIEPDDRVVPTEEPSAVSDTDQTFNTEKVEKKTGTKTALVVLVAIVAAIAAGAFITGLFPINSTDSVRDSSGPTSSVAENANPDSAEISDHAIGTGVLYEDCDILASADSGADVEGRLVGGTDVLIYAEVGKYFKVSDPDRLIAGYVLKEKVDTGEADSSDTSSAE